MKKINVIVLFLLVPVAAFASDSFTVSTPTPVIYLAKNLDESQGLGWCIDTLGRGYSEDLQVHSCKPRGGDVQFTLLEKNKQIQSVAFPEKCVALVDEKNQQVPFGLRDCTESDSSQQFQYDAKTGQLQLLTDTSRCIAAGDKSRSAGPFMSRDLLLVPCEAYNPDLTRWVVRQ